MRFLVFKEDDAAKALVDQLREGGDTASFRNPQFFNTAELEKCDAVYTDSDEIRAAYEAAEIEVRGFAVEAAPEPKKKGKK